MRYIVLVQIKIQMILDILKKYDEIITRCQEEINVYVKNLNSAEFISNRLKENNMELQFILNMSLF